MFGLQSFTSCMYDSKRQSIDDITASFKFLTPYWSAKLQT